jgi:hypothetical protein
MINNCKICGDEYTAYNLQHKVCSKSSCKKKSRNDRYLPFKSKWKIPIRLITRYGIKFLQDNPIVLEALQISHKLNGHYELLDKDVIKIRQKNYNENYKKEYAKNYRLKKSLDKECVICGKVFKTLGNKSNYSITCSNECSIQRRKQNNRKTYLKNKQK